MRDFRIHSQASIFLKLGTLLLVVLAVGVLVVNSSQPAQAQEVNLLVNPSFEGPYGSFVPPGGNPDCPAGICTTAQTAAGWTPWWWIVAGRDNAIYANPEYKPAEARDFAGRVRSGERAQQYFNFGRTNTAGVFQQLTVPANAQLRFSVWGMAWSTGIAWDGPNSDVPYSAEPTPVNLRVGIDPTGGTDAFSPNIVWSGTLNPYDQYALLSVDAQAQGSLVTVFTYSSPNEPRKHNDIYWDDASLVVLGAGGAPVVTNPGGGSVAAAPAAPVSFVLAPTATPDAEGVIYATVPSGGSIWSVAANAGITLDQILEYNNLTRDDFVNAGQLLIVGYGEPNGGEEAAAATPEAAAAALTATSEITPTDVITDAAVVAETAVLAQPAASEAAPAATGGEAETAAPAAAAAEAAAPVAAESQAEGILVSEPKVSGASICLKAFEDANQNGLHDPGEALRANVAFTISNEQRVVSNYVTTGTSEPYCLPGLTAGNYQVTRSQQNDEVLTTRGDWGLALTDGSVVTMEFGSYTGQAVASADQNATSADLQADPEVANAAVVEAETAQSGGLANGITIAAVVLAALLLVVVVGLLLTARRAS